jgi:NADH-quinone oxidoreductase subunit K
MLMPILVLAAFLIAFGFSATLLATQHLIINFIGLELMLVGNTLTFLEWSGHMPNAVHGHVAVLFLLMIAACEAAIGLSIMVVVYRAKHTVAMSDLTSLTDI